MELPGPNGTKSSTSSPSRHSQSSGRTSSPSFSLRGISSSPSSSLNEPSGGGTGKSPNAFAKFFSQLKNLIAEAATIEPTSDVASGVDHCCKTSRCHYGLPIHHLDSESLAALSQSASTSSSSDSFPVVSSRLIVYRDCDRRGRKILFDSEHVSSDYVYLKPTDPKLLKQLGEYVFGCVPLASASSTSSPALDLPTAACGHKRFCKWKLEGHPHHDHKTNKTLYIWSKIFELGSYNSNRSTKQETATSDYSSSSSEHSSSGYESGGGGSSSSSAGKTFSLPLFPSRPSSSSWSSSGGGGHSSVPQTRSLPGRIDNYRTNLALVWILAQEDGQSPKIPLPYLSPLVEALMLNPLSHITHNFYHNSNYFVTSLKNVSTSLSHDLTEFLSNSHVVNLSLVKPPLADMVNLKLVSRFLELILTNLDSSVVLNLKKWTEVKALLYFLKVVLKTCVCKCNLLDSRRDSLVETGTDVISAAAASELDCVDSGIELEGTSSSKLLSSNSTFQASRKWSIVSEEGSDIGGGDSSHDDEDDADCGRVSFHLGDADVDQSEAKLALGEVDFTKLKGGSERRRPSLESSASGGETAAGDSDYIPPNASSLNRRPPLEIKLSMSDSKLKDACTVKYTPCYHCNGTYVTEHSRFNPFYFCQVMTKPGQQVVYDMEYVTFMKIIECYGSGAIRSFNLNEEGSTSTTTTTSSSSSSSTTSLFGDDNTNTQEPNELSRKIKEVVEGYIQLAKVTNDSGKLDSYATFQMEEIRDNIL